MLVSQHKKLYTSTCKWMVFFIVIVAQSSFARTRKNTVGVFYESQLFRCTFYPRQACLRGAVNLLSITSLFSSLPQRHYTLTRIGLVEVKNIALSDHGEVIRDTVIGRHPVN